MSCLWDAQQQLATGDSSKGPSVGDFFLTSFLNMLWKHKLVPELDRCGFITRISCLYHFFFHLADVCFIFRFTESSVGI